VFPVEQFIPWGVWGIGHGSERERGGDGKGWRGGRIRAHRGVNGQGFFRGRRGREVTEGRCGVGGD
jgi:hypothetical protein